MMADVFDMFSKRGKKSGDAGNSQDEVEPGNAGKQPGKE
jgi:hypothetical protein